MSSCHLFKLVSAPPLPTRRLLLVFFLVSTAMAASSQSLTAAEKALEEWLPSTFGEHEAEGPAHTITMQSEGKPYIMSTKSYRKGASTLTVVVFDYKEIPELLKKNAASWSGTPADNDPQKPFITTVEGFPAWQHNDAERKASQLYVNVRDRYLLFLSITPGTTDFLKSVVRELKPRGLPQ